VKNSNFCSMLCRLPSKKYPGFGNLTAYDVQITYKDDKFLSYSAQVLAEENSTCRR
jgi:hypothetical protein